MWIKAIEGFDEAKREVSELAELSPGDYFISTRAGDRGESSHRQGECEPTGAELREEY